MVQWHWSIAELADHADMPRSTVSSILNLQRFPSSDLIEGLSFPMGMELYELDLLAKFELAA